MWQLHDITIAHFSASPPLSKEGGKGTQLGISEVDRIVIKLSSDSNKKIHHKFYVPKKTGL